MPIYKVTSHQPVYGAKFRAFELSTTTTEGKTAAPHDHNGEETIHVNEDNTGQNRETGRRHTVPLIEVQQQEIERTAVPTKVHRESFIEREVREQLRREAELAALHGLPQKKPLWSAAETDTANIRVTTEENGGRSDHIDHVVQDVVGTSKEQVVVEERTVVVTSKDGDVQRTTTTTTTTTTTGGAGGVGGGGGGGSGRVSKEVTLGGSRILYELQQQAEREEELRKHRKGMGWNGVEGSQEDGESDRSGSVDIKTDLRVDWDVTDGRLEESRHRLPDVVIEAPEHKLSPSDGYKGAPNDGTKLGPSDGTSSPLNHQQQQSKSVVTTRRLSSKVHPFEDVERIQSEVQMIYVPQDETPIDREIRLHREREDALRLSRGILSTVIDSSPAEVEVEVLRPRPLEDGGGPTSGQGGLSMKRFAESRLRSELEREKKRELDLLKEGKIIVLSADRMPDTVTYVEVISPEKAELQEMSRIRSSEGVSVTKDVADREIAWQEVASREVAPKNVAQRENTWQEATWRDTAPKYVTPREAVQKETPSKKVVLVELTPKELPDPVHVEVRNGHAAQDDRTEEVTVVDPAFHSPKSETRLSVTRGSTERPGRGLRPNSASPNSYSEEDVQKILLSVAEQRIEEEIAETKKRELELRELRKHRLSLQTPREPVSRDTRSNSAHVLSISTKTESSDRSSPEPIGDGHRHDDATEVHVTVALDTVDSGGGDDRSQQPTEGQSGSKARRLALIDQWERGVFEKNDF